MNRRRHFELIVLMLFLACIVAPPRALAHAFLDHADPPVGSTVSPSPRLLTLSFTEPVEPAFCGVHVSDSKGRQIETGPLQFRAPDTIAVAVPTLVPGSYTVTWSVVSVDTHPTQGHFTFSVGTK